MNRDQLLGIILMMCALACLAACPAFAEAVDWWSGENPGHLSGGRFVIRAYLMLATIISFIGAIVFGAAAVGVFTRQQTPKDQP